MYQARRDGRKLLARAAMQMKLAVTTSFYLEQGSESRQLLEAGEHKLWKQEIGN